MGNEDQTTKKRASSAKGEKVASKAKRKVPSGEQALSEKAKNNKVKGSTAIIKSKGLKTDISKSDTKKRKVNCMLPGADLLEQGKSVEEVMKELEEREGIELSPEHEVFCLELSVENNQTKAYMRAYPDSGYEAARRSASSLMTNPDIIERVKQLREERNERLKLDGDSLLQSLYNNAKANMRDLYRPDGSLVPINELHPDIAASIQQIEVEELFAGRGDDRQVIGLVRKYKLVDRLKAAELVGRNLKLWKDVGSPENPLEANLNIEVVFGED